MDNIGNKPLKNGKSRSAVFTYTGSFGDISFSRNIDVWDTKAAIQIVKEAKEKVFYFHFTFDAASGHCLEISPKYFVGGMVHTSKSILRSGIPNSNRISNQMIRNGIGRVYINLDYNIIKEMSKEDEHLPL